MSKKNIKHTKRDRDPNVLQAGLQCLHCGRVEYSQGNLKIHLYRETDHWKSYAVLCGCCNNLFNDPDLLAFHLNQTGATARAPFVVPQQVRQVTPFGGVPRAAAASFSFSHIYSLSSIPATSGSSSALPIILSDSPPHSPLSSSGLPTFEASAATSSLTGSSSLSALTSTAITYPLTTTSVTSSLAILPSTSSALSLPRPAEQACSSSYAASFFLLPLIPSTRFCLKGVYPSFLSTPLLSCLSLYLTRHLALVLHQSLHFCLTMNLPI